MYIDRRYRGRKRRSPWPVIALLVLVLVPGGYLLATRTRLAPGTLAVLISPVLLLLAAWNPWAPAAAWAGFCLFAAAGKSIFSPQEKRQLLSALASLRKSPPRA